MMKMLVKGLRALVGLGDRARDAQIKASDQRITENFLQAHKVLSSPDTPRAQLDAAAAELNEISVKCLRNGLGPLSGPGGIKP